ncbi:MAG TPA: hypothetical protein VKV05_03260 [Terriglobales bacterium]|nr:hypothetical protein [Terriglobales bacterium]
MAKGLRPDVRPSGLLAAHHGAVGGEQINTINQRLFDEFGVEVSDGPDATLNYLKPRAKAARRGEPLALPYSNGWNRGSCENGIAALLDPALLLRGA